MRRVLALALLATVTYGQDKGPTGPRPLIEKFLATAEKGDAASMKAAGALFDLSDVTRADRELIGERAAADLYNYLIRQTFRFFRSIPSKADGPTYEVGAIVLTKLEDGTWRISQETRQKAAELFESVREKKVQKGKADVSTSETWLRDAMPEWLRGKAFLLAHWQWLGLLLLILVGMIASAIASFFFFRVGQRLARMRGIELKRGRKVGRPFGLVAMAAVWWIGLIFLLLPENAYRILILATRFLLMAGVVLSINRIVDWVMEVVPPR